MRGTTSMSRLRFGLFIPPVHNIGQNPTLALHRDVELAVEAERLGYDEVWFGEHHSAGTEWIPSPEVFIGYVAAKTSRIKLGTGAISLTYHNPLWVADRMILLDHLTRGRVICGLGPGSLATDAHMIGLSTTDLRDALEEDVDVLVRLLRTDEPVSIKTSRYELHEARCQLRPYSDPCFELAIPGVASPVAPRLAGRYGAGLISLGSSSKEAGEFLASHWQLAEERAAEYDQQIDRSQWWLTSHMHIAESKEQALKDMEHGFMTWFQYFKDNTTHPAFVLEGETFEERFEFLMEARAVVVGTPDDAIAEIERFNEITGGFGCFLQFEHEWVNREAKMRHHELFAQYVMPHFQNQLTRPDAAYAHAKAERAKNAEEMGKAVGDYIAKHS
jgi:alkanesulfonate monooxygenase SsuD/methylene tetrahydromethanopterin reductase-like flavin-dependent oxidoreductase (luciferase family)